MVTRHQNRRERDLFDFTQPPDKKTRKKAIFHLPSIKNNLTLTYENTIFLAIGFIMACIIFFSLGVEKGRQDVSVIKEEGRTPEPLTSFGYGASQSTETRSDRIESKITIPEKISQDGYVIQLAAFVKKEAAKREQKELKELGYNADIKKSGDYYQLYLSNFGDKKSAETLMETLKKRYKDCYIYSRKE